MKMKKPLVNIASSSLLFLACLLLLLSCSGVQYFPKYSFSSPDGRYLVEGDRSQKLLTIRKAATGRLLKSWGSEVIEKASCYDFTPDEKYLAIASGNKVQIWDVERIKLIMSIVEDSRVEYCSFSLDGTTICTGTGSQRISLWDFKTGRRLWNVRFNRDLDPFFSVFTSRLAFGPNYLAAGGTGLVELYELSSGQVLARFILNKPGFSIKEGISVLAASAEGRYLAAGFYNKTIILMDTESRQELWRTPALKGVIRLLAFHPDGRFLLSGTTDVMADTMEKDWELKIWDIETGKEVADKTGLDVVGGGSLDGRIFVRGKNGYSLITYYWGGNWIEEAKGDVLENALKSLVKQVSKEMSISGFERLAITEFRPLSGGASMLEKRIREELVTRIASNNDFTVVERALMNQVLDELKLSISEIMVPNYVKRFGNLTGADAILAGTVTDLGGKIKINARLMATETGEVFAVVSLPVFKDGQVRAMLE